jgi:hypothetical protein
MVDGLSCPRNVNGRTLRHARRPVSIDLLWSVARFRIWRQPLASLARGAQRAGP